MAENEAENDHKQDSEPAFYPEKVYIKDVSFETPNSPAIFTKEWKPSLSFDLAEKITELGENHFEVILTLTATVKVDDLTAYLAEVQQAGIFLMKGLDTKQLHRILNVMCPRMLYPYASYAISDLVTRGGFPQLVLTPVNFKALYQQRLTEAGTAR